MRNGTENKRPCWTQYWTKLLYPLGPIDWPASIAIVDPTQRAFVDLSICLFSHNPSTPGERSLQRKNKHIQFQLCDDSRSSLMSLFVAIRNVDRCPLSYGTVLTLLCKTDGRIRRNRGRSHCQYCQSVVYRWWGGGWGVQTAPKFRRPSKIMPNSTRLWKPLKKYSWI